MIEPIRRGKCRPCPIFSIIADPALITSIQTSVKIEKRPGLRYRACMDIRLARYAELVSTMDMARTLIGSLADSGLIVLADMQTGGRGRLEGRTWEGARGSSLFMTLCLKGDFSASRALPLRIGLAVHEVLSASALSSVFGIKWPNDIMGRNPSRPGSQGFLGFGKLGGILCETAGQWLLAGIGINLRKSAYSPLLGASATSLEEVLGKNAEGGGEPDIPALCMSFGKAAAARLEKPEWHDEYERNMIGIGGEVRFMAGHPGSGLVKSGRIVGVDDSGRLLLSAEDGTVEAFWSGEISGLRSLD